MCRSSTEGDLRLAGRGAAPRAPGAQGRGPRGERRAGAGGRGGVGELQGHQGGHEAQRRLPKTRRPPGERRREESLFEPQREELKSLKEGLKAAKDAHSAIKSML